jgi:ubiquinone/menaquinone biosynthesis C-methylase UbiE
VSQRINYDEVAEHYDKDGYRKKDVDPSFARFVSSQSKSLDVLDIGCGTGSQLVVLKEVYPQHRYTGLDYSSQMLTIAKRKNPNIKWVHGDAQNLPFEDSSFDFVSSQYHIHHVPDKSKMLSEVYRILRTGGWFALTNSVPFEMRDWPIYQYFPESYERDCKDYLPTLDLIELGESKGFKLVTSQTRPKVSQVPVEKFLEDVRRKTSCSQLIALTDEEYQRGLKSVENDLKGQREPVEIHIAELTLILEK